MKPQPGRYESFGNYIILQATVGKGWRPAGLYRYDNAGTTVTLTLVSTYPDWDTAARALEWHGSETPRVETVLR